jgi:hypothetical protein
MIRLELIVKMVSVYIYNALKLRDLYIVCLLKVKPNYGLELEYLYIESRIYIFIPESFANVLVSALILFLAR